METHPTLQRQKECRVSVAQSAGPGLAAVFRGLHDNRQLRASHQCPVLVKPERQYRLIDLERVLGGRVGTIEKIGLVTQRQHDSPGHRVLGFLGQFGVGLALGSTDWAGVWPFQRLTTARRAL
jgi:hypothetical protein